MVFRAFSLIFFLMTVMAGPAFAKDMVCKVKSTPKINIEVITDDINYDFSKDSAALTKMRSDTVSPYAKGVDSISGGLREDHPQYETDMSWNIEYNEATNIGCMWFKDVNVTIHLRPKIYIASDFNKGACQDAIVTHEKKHVEVDRIVMNNFANNVGVAVQKAVAASGAVGPFNMNSQDRMQAGSKEYIVTVIHQQEVIMEREMRERQSKVDSLQEYEAVSAICRPVIGR